MACHARNFISAVNIKSPPRPLKVGMRFHALNSFTYILRRKSLTLSHNSDIWLTLNHTHTYPALYLNWSSWPPREMDVYLSFF